MHKIITILEATVRKEKWGVLQNAYRETLAKQSPDTPFSPLQSFLVQMKEDPTIWRIITIWKNMEVLQGMKSSGETPAGVLIFRKAEAEPTLSISESKEELTF